MVNKFYFKIIFGSILIIGLLSACKKEWLEAKPDDRLAVPATVRDFQGLLDHYPSVNRNSLLINEVAADGHYYIQNNFDALNAALRNAYTWSSIEPFEIISEYIFQYSPLYSLVLNTNIILTESEKVNNEDKKALEQVRAQALFHRGRTFFDLSQSFSPPYTSSGENAATGIPLRLNTEITSQSVRSTLKQTYDQIISDLTIAKNILPDVPVFLTRASKPAALGLLARVYLAKGDYANAFASANEYLTIKNTLLDYSTVSSAATVIGVNKEIAYLNFYNNGSELSNFYLIDQELYDSFDADDLRKKVFFGTDAAGIIFKGHYSDSPNDIFCGVATDEMYLIRAECFARNRNLTAAMKDLNDLLRTRWAKNPDGSTKYTDQSAINDTDALHKIFAERKKQLILRNVRWADLRRLNQDDRFKTTLSRTIGGKTYLLEPNSQRYTFPFPNEVISTSGMSQNPGWSN